MRKVLPLLMVIVCASFTLHATPLKFAFNSPPSGPYQALNVSGKVTDEAGAGMPGVNIIVKGTSTGTTTDADGVYKLELSNELANGTLVFSFIGYATQEQPINGRSQIDLKLTVDVRALNEIVVTGYGEQRRSDITGSIVSVNEQALRDVPVSSLAEALQGRGAGIDIQKGGGNSKPGAVPVIRIRGVRSVRAGNDPLFVVDGLPFNGSLNDLNPEDITSLEVLKDASATAIYGSRGANGVILITTKRGKEGKPVISYSGYTGVNKVLGKYNVMNGEQYARLKKYARVYGNTPGTYSGVDDPKILTDGFAPQERESLDLGRSTDWQDLIYKSGIMTNHQLGFSGGTDKSQYALSAGYFKETGIYPGQSFERVSLKASIDQQFGKRVKLGFSTLNTFTLRKGEGFNPMGQVLRASPLATPYDPNGDLWGFLPGSANQIWNPLADFIEDAKIEKRERYGTFTTLYAEVKLIEGLKYKFNSGVEIRSDVYGNFYNSATSNNLGGPSTSSNRRRSDFAYTIENLLTYDKVFAEKHRLNFTGLYSIQESNMNSNEFNNSAIVSSDLQYYNPQFGSNLKGRGDYEKWAILSYMGRINYGFDDRYLLTLTMRTDGSSRLAPKNQWQTFPSVAVAWNLSQENFMQGIPVLSSLKLRGSYGTVGNTSIDPYQTLGLLSAATYNFADRTTTGLFLSNVVNPNLEWEYTTSYNVGLDFGLLNNRISGTVEAYQQLTDKLLLPQGLPPSSGIPNAILTNIGETENRGIEIQISAVNIQGDGRDKLSWSTDINFFVNRGKILKLASGGKDDIGNNWFIGQPIGTIYDYKKIGIWQATPEDSAAAKALNLTLTGTGSVIGNIRVEDINGRDENGNIIEGPDSRITDADRMIIGSSQPKWQGGFTNRIAFKGFDFTVVAFARVGSTITSRVHNSGFANTFQGNYNNLNIDFWTVEDPSNVWPKPNNASTNTANSSTLGYFDGTYMKIRSLSLGYNVPTSLMNRIGGKSARVYATVNDAFILFSDFRNDWNMDPEGINSGSNVPNLEVDTPASYSVVFGLNLTF